MARRLLNGLAARQFRQANRGSTMEFTKVSTIKGGAVQTINSEVATTLEGAGMPRKVYITLSDAPLEGHDSIEGAASISQKDGRVMYNFGAKATLKAVVGRLQGNFFLPKDGWTVDAGTLKAYQVAKAEQLATRTASIKK